MCEIEITPLVANHAPASQLVEGSLGSRTSVALWHEVGAGVYRQHRCLQSPCCAEDDICKGRFLSPLLTSVMPSPAPQAIC